MVLLDMFDKGEQESSSISSTEAEVLPQQQGKLLTGSAMKPSEDHEEVDDGKRIRNKICHPWKTLTN